MKNPFFPLPVGSDLFCKPLTQEDLAALYRGHDAMLFTSRYEAWGMPGEWTEVCFDTMLLLFDS